MSDHGSDNNINYKKNDNAGDVNDIYINFIATNGAIWLLPTIGRKIFHVTWTILQVFQMRGTFGGLDHMNPHEHLQNFVDIHVIFLFNNISQDLIWLRLFPFSLTGEATRWLAELPNDTITSWKELTDAFLERFFPPSRMFKLRDNIQNFKRVGGEPLH